MRIGVVTTSYPRSDGEAAGTFVSELNDWIASRGHQVDVLAAGSKSETGDTGPWQKHPVERVFAGSGLFYQGGAPEALHSKRRAWQALRFSTRLLLQARKRQHNWDGVVAHWLAPSAMVCVLAASNKPIWAIAHGGDVYLLEKLGLTASVARLLDRPNVHLNFVSRSVRDVFARNAGNAGRSLIARAGVCPMGISLPATRRERPTKNKTRLLFLGRLVAITGVDILLDAMSLVQQAGESDYELTIAGHGPQRESLQRQAAQLGIEARWPGEVRGLERDQLLARADLVIIPSRTWQGREEGMPRVALEALASGAQLLVASSGGLAEIPGSLCHRVPPADPQAMAVAIREILAGKEAPHQGGHWLASHSWPELGPRLLPGLSHAQV